MGELRQTIDQGLAMLRRRRWLAAAVFVVAFAASLAAVRALPVLYQATTVVAIEEQQIPEAFVKSTVTGQLEARLLRMSQELLSQARLEELVNQFSLYPEYRSRATTRELAGRLRGDIELEVRGVQSRVRGTPLMALSISYRGNDPTTVPAVVNALASGYVRENTRLRERDALGTSDFLKGHLREAAERLDQQEQKVSAFKRRYLGELPEQSQANLATIERLNDQLRNTREAQIRARERIEQRAQTNSLTTSLRVLAGDTGAPTGETATARINRLKQELVELRFSDKYPDVTQKQAEIAMLERLVEAGGLPVSDGQPARSSATGDASPATSAAARREDDELRLLNDEEKRLRAEIAIYQGRIENTPKREQEFLELSRDYESTKELYVSLLKRYEDAQLAGNLEHRQKGEQLRILEPATGAASSSPRRLRVTALALVGALALAAVAAFLVDTLDTSFHTPADVRGFTGVPLLAAIPLIATKRDVRRRYLQLLLGSVATAVAVVVFAGVAHYVATGNQQIVLMLMRFGI